MDNFKIIDSKKYMWDGTEYDNKSAAQEKIKKYSADKFETKLIEEGEKFFVFTRRVVTEIHVEEQAI